MSGHDLPQSFVGTIVYEPPVGKGKKFGSSMNKVANAALGGWQVATVARFSSGLPLQVSAPNKLSVCGFNVLRPNIANLTDLNQGRRTPDHWFNTAAVTAPAPFTLGNASRWLANARYAPIEQAFRRRRISAIANFCARSYGPKRSTSRIPSSSDARTPLSARRISDASRVMRRAPGRGIFNSACASISEFPPCAIACCRSM